MYGLPTAPPGRKAGLIVKAGLITKLTDGEVPPAQPRLVMVTGTVPGEATSEARIVVDAVVASVVVVGVELVEECCTPLNVISEPTGTNRESGQKLVPVRVNVKLALPAVRKDGLKEVITCPKAGVQTASIPSCQIHRFTHCLRKLIARFTLT